MEASSHDPQEQPPPPSGESSMPLPGMVLIQQSGRSRLQVEDPPSSIFQTQRSPARKIKVLEVAA